MKKNIYNVEQENPSQLGLTWQTQNPRYETKIKKKRISKVGLGKKTEVQ
jgi:hypothetical protein